MKESFDTPLVSMPPSSSRVRSPPSRVSCTFTLISARCTRPRPSFPLAVAQLVSLPRVFLGVAGVLVAAGRAVSAVHVARASPGAVASTISAPHPSDVCVLLLEGKWFADWVASVALWWVCVAPSRHWHRALCRCSTVAGLSRLRRPSLPKSWMGPGLSLCSVPAGVAVQALAPTLVPRALQLVWPRRLLRGPRASTLSIWRVDMATGIPWWVLS
jgi:hypothetical protein